MSRKQHYFVPRFESWRETPHIASITDWSGARVQRSIGSLSLFRHHTQSIIKDTCVRTPTLSRIHTRIYIYYYTRYGADNSGYRLGFSTKRDRRSPGRYANAGVFPRPRSRAAANSPRCLAQPRYNIHSNTHTHTPHTAHMCEYIYVSSRDP